MLLMAPSEAATLIGAKCGGAVVTNDDILLAAILSAITSRVEEALNVKSLVRGAYCDEFELVNMPSGSCYAGLLPRVRLRLSNGFLLQDSATVYGPDGEIVCGCDNLKVEDLEKGIIHLTSWQRGIYKVEYVSGFEPEPIPATPPDGYDADMRVLQNIPAWMKGIVANYLVLWFKTTQLQPKASKDLSYAGVLNGLRREVYAWVYGKYQRPRLNCIFPVI